MSPLQKRRHRGHVPHLAGANTVATERHVARLRRIEGQVRGIHRMVAGDRHCSAIMTQIASVHEALRAVGRECIRDHLWAATIGADSDDMEPIHEELLDMTYRLIR